MKHLSRQVLLPLALAVVFIRAETQAPPPDCLLHKPAPVFVRTDLDLRRIDLSAFRGRVVLLTFWATWCAPCRVEIPHFVAWQRRYTKQGLQILAVSMDDDSATVRAMLHKHPVNYPVLMGDNELATQYGGILGLPVTLLIDRKGDVAARFKGEGNLQNLQHELLRLLRSP
jgi:thiol-disulfide isomerase/thioredoxin